MPTMRISPYSLPSHINTFHLHIPNERDHLLFPFTIQQIKAAFVDVELITVVIGVEVEHVLIMLWNFVHLFEFVVTTSVSDLGVSYVLIQVLLSYLPGHQIH